MTTAIHQLTLPGQDQPEPEYALVALADLPPNDEIGGLEPTKDFIHSVHTYGLLSPVRLARGDDGTYRVIYGRRRVKAVRALDWEVVPALIVPGSGNEAMISLQENIARAADQRQEITVILDLAARGASVADIRKVLPSRTAGQIKKILRLRALTPVLQQAVVDGRLLVSAAYEATDLKLPLQTKLEGLLAEPKKVIGPADVEPLKRVQVQSLQQRFEDLFTQEVPSADDVARDAACWQGRAVTTLREVLAHIPEDHPAWEAVSAAITALDDASTTP